jgi:hypothetical protein
MRNLQRAAVAIQKRAQNAWRSPVPATNNGTYPVAKKAPDHAPKVVSARSFLHAVEIERANSILIAKILIGESGNSSGSMIVRSQVIPFPKAEGGRAAAVSR